MTDAQAYFQIGSIIGFVVGVVFILVILAVQKPSKWAGKSGKGD